MNSKIKHIAAPDSSQAYSWHSASSLDALLLHTLKDPRTHNLYLYVQNDPLNHIDPSGHVAHAGGGSGSNFVGPQQPNCTRCNNGRNIPTPALTCFHCGRRRQTTPPPPPPPVWVQPPGNPNPAAWSAPPSGGTTQASNNVSAKARAAEVKTNKKNSVNVPQQEQGQSSRQVDWSRLGGYLRDIGLFVWAVGSLIASAFAFAAGAAIFAVPGGQLKGGVLMAAAVMSFMAATVGIINHAEAFGRALQGLLRGTWINEVPPPQESAIIGRIGNGRVTRATLQPVVNGATFATGNFSTFLSGPTGRTVNSAVAGTRHANQWNRTTSSIANAGTAARNW